MHTGLFLAAMALWPAPQAADTVIPVERGVRLEVGNAEGEVVVRAWDRDAVRVRAELEEDHRLGIDRSGSLLRVRPRSLRGRQDDADLLIDVPRWMNIRVHGNQVDVGVAGTTGEVSVETIDGDIVVEGGSGLVVLRSIEGEIGLRGARGRVEVASVNDDIVLVDLAGEVQAEATNGDIEMRNVRASSARASTVNGDIVYDGTLQPGGRYSFTTHNGDLVLTVPSGTDAAFHVATVNGEFESEFPVRLSGSRDRQFDFTLGSGSARIELQTFNGEILLRRP